jgi:hypothetical protein
MARSAAREMNMRQALKDTTGELEKLLTDLQVLLAGGDPLPAMVAARGLVELERLRADLEKLLLGLQVAAAPANAPP